MRRRTAGLAVVLCLLLVAAPIAAQTGLVAISSHSTDSEFANGDITNASIEGSGPSAVVAATAAQDSSQSATGIDPTSSQSITVGGDFDPVGPDGTGDPVLTATGYGEQWFNKSTGTWSIDDDPDRAFDTSNIPDTIEGIRVYYDDGWSSGSAGDAEIYLNVGDTDDGTFDGGTHIGTAQDSYGSAHWRYIDVDSFNTTGSSTLTMEVESSSSRSAQFDGTSGGNIRFYSSPPEGVSVSDGQGNTANLGTFSEGETKTATIDVSTDTSQLDWSAVSADPSLDWTLEMGEIHYDGEGSYTSTDHIGSDLAQGFTNLTLENAEATVEWEYYDGSAWQAVASDTFSTTGNHTVDISGHDSDTWRTTVTFSAQSGDTTAHLNDEGILYGSSSATVSDPDPSGDETITSVDPTLSAEINDADFQTSQGDTVTAEIYLDGTLVDTQTRSSNGSISHTANELGGGSHEWHVELSDEYGHSVTSSTWEFSTPTQLQIFNETNPNERITSPTEVTVQFYAENGSVYERSTTDGNVSFDGLPVDQDFVVTASADGYRSRTIYIESLIEQNQVYLLDENVTAASVVYSLNDNTGDFSPPEETTLFVEKPLNISGSTQYRTVTSSQFSATNEIPATLEDDQRYRLRLQGPNGATRVLGSYTTAGDHSPTLTVGQISFGGATASNPSFHANVETVDGTRVLRISYYDPANATETLTLRAVNRSDSSDAVRPETTEIGPYGQYSEVIPLSSSADHVSFNVTYEAQRTGYADVNGTVFVGDLPPIAQDFGLDPDVLSAIGYLTILGVLGLTAIAYPRFAGIPTTVVAIGLTTLGVVAIHPLLLGGAGVISLLFAVGGGRT